MKKTVALIKGRGALRGRERLNAEFKAHRRDRILHPEKYRGK
jgi:hypothetical protein